MLALTGDWWHFERYRLVLIDEPLGRRAELVIEPDVESALTTYSVADLHERLGSSRALYNELARVGAGVRDWYLRAPFFIESRDGMEAEDVLRFHQAQDNYEKQRDPKAPWLDELMARGLDKPVLDWCAAVGLLGLSAINEEDSRSMYKRERSCSSLDEIIELHADPEYQRLYRENFVVFVEAAMNMDSCLRGLRTAPASDRGARGGAVATLGAMLDPVGLTVSDDEGQLQPGWRSSSLLGYLAALACFDLAGGVQIGVCERCGRTFTTRRRDKRFCSEPCRDAQKKARRRANPVNRKAERERQRDRRGRKLGT